MQRSCVSLLSVAVAVTLAGCGGTNGDDVNAGAGPDTDAGTDIGTGMDTGTDGSGGADRDTGADSAVDGGADGGQGLCPGDRLKPWAGGASYYQKWTNGPPPDPSFFPIAVWLQDPSNAASYKALGVNFFIGLWNGPTDGQLTGLAGAGMPVMCDQNQVGLANLTSKTIIGWTQQDEPDNAQSDGHGGWGSCILPADVQSLYQKMTTADPSRPVFLNLGQTLANESWVGRGDVCSGHDEHYPEYIRGADIVSYDIYPVTNTDSTAGELWLVAHGVQRLLAFANFEKPVWNWIETTHVNNPNVRPTPAQVRAEVWMSLIHGSMGIGYFAHEFAPSFIEAGLLHYADISDSVTKINAEITGLARVLNSPTVENGVTVQSSDTSVPVATMVKRQTDATYLFAVAMRDGSTTATFSLTCVAADAKVDVLGESRTIQLSASAFSDHFGGYDVHLYKVGR